MGEHPPNWTAPADHDPATCRTCAPILRSEAWARGVARANSEQATMPTTSRQQV